MARPLASGHILLMLILSRKSGQSIVIADNITMKVVRVKGDQTGLSVQAPPEIAVHRAEIQAEIDAGKRPSPHGGADALKTILGLPT